MKAKLVNEGGIEDFGRDEGNLAAMRSWTAKPLEKNYEMSILEPSTITFKSEKDYFTFKYLFNKYRIKYTERTIE